MDRIHSLALACAALLLALAPTAHAQQIKPDSDPSAPATYRLTTLAGSAAQTDDLRQVDPTFTWRPARASTIAANSLLNGLDAAMSAGDVDGDGLDDALRLSSAGRVLDVTTDDPSDLTAISALYPGSGAAPQQVRSQLFPVGDLNGDGRADALGYDDSATQAARLYLGAASGYAATSAQITLARPLNGSYHPAADLGGSVPREALWLGDEGRVLAVSYDGTALSTRLWVKVVVTGSFVYNVGTIVGFDVADYTGDGLADVVFAGRDVRTQPGIQVGMYYGGESGAAGCSAAAFSRVPRGTATIYASRFVDYNADGTLDLAVVTADGTAICGIGPAPNPGLSIAAYPVGDVNDDGIDDFVRLTRSDSIGVYYGPLDPATRLFADSAFVDLPDGMSLRSTVVKEQNMAQGGRELVLPVSSGGLGYVRIALGAPGAISVGTPVTSPSTPSAYVPETYRLGDLNGDGREDFGFVVSRSDRAEGEAFGRIEVYYGASPMPAEPSVVIPFSDDVSSIYSLAAADVNGDGRGDLAIGVNVSGSGEMRLHLGGAGGVATQPSRIVPAAELFPSADAANLYQLNAVAVGDVTGDGRADLYVNAPAAGASIVLPGTASGLSQTPLPIDLGDQDGVRGGGARVVAGDFNGDGISDLAVSEGFPGPNPLVYYGTADATQMATHDVTVEVQGVFAMAAGDFDGNGRDDLAVIPFSRNSNSIRMWDGGFANSSGTGFTYTAAFLPVETLGMTPDDFGAEILGLDAVPDLDGDGDDELLVSTTFQTIFASSPQPTNALLYRGGVFSTFRRMPVAVLAAPNPYTALGSDMNSIFGPIKPLPVADFDGDGTVEVILTQARDNNDGGGTSRVYAFPLAAGRDNATVASVGSPALLPTPDAASTGSIVEVIDLVVSGRHAAMSVRLGALSEFDEADGEVIVVTFERTGASWTQTGVLRPFGSPIYVRYTLALDGDRMLVGLTAAPDRGAQGSGLVYAYAHGSGGWTLDQTIGTAVALTDNRFGRTLALSGDLALVGSDNGGGSSGSAGGRVYSLRYAAGAWTLEGRVRHGEDATDEGGFGSGLALDGTRALIGAPFLDDGRAFVFEREGGEWTFRYVMASPSDAPSSPSYFGNLVALDGDRALVESSGTVFVYDLQGTDWVRTARLDVLGDEADYDVDHLALSGELALVSTDQYIDATEPEVGALFVYTRSGERWNERVVVGERQRSRFGAGLAISDARAFVSGGTASGAVAAYGIDLSALVTSAERPDALARARVSVAPNPARTRARVALTTVASGPASARVYDLLGRQVATLHDGSLPAGTHRLDWDLSGVPSGLYFVRLTSLDGVAMQTVSVVR